MVNTLDDFGDDDGGPRPPTVNIRGRVRVPTPDGVMTVGWWGDSPELGHRALVATKDYQHRIREQYDDVHAFGISDRGLADCQALGVETILIREPDTGDVYEYHLEDFTEYGDPVEDWILDYPKADPQTCVRRSDPLHVYPDHADEVKQDVR